MKPVQFLGALGIACGAVAIWKWTGIYLAGVAYVLIGGTILKKVG